MAFSREQQQQVLFDEFYKACSNGYRSQADVKRITEILVSVPEIVNLEIGPSRVSLPKYSAFLLGYCYSSLSVLLSFRSVEHH
jgi:hypothetical protein